jgi:hypothetical protein
MPLTSVEELPAGGVTAARGRPADAHSAAARMIEPAASRMSWAMRTAAGLKNCGRNRAIPVAKRMALAQGRTCELALLIGGRLSLHQGAAALGAELRPRRVCVTARAANTHPQSLRRPPLAARRRPTSDSGIPRAHQPVQPRPQDVSRWTAHGLPTRLWITTGQPYCRARPANQAPRNGRSAFARQTAGCTCLNRAEPAICPATGPLWRSSRLTERSGTLRRRGDGPHGPQQPTGLPIGSQFGCPKARAMPRPCVRGTALF